MKRLAPFAIVVAFLALSACGDGGTQTQPDDERRNEPTGWYLRSISDDGRTIAFVYLMSGVASGCELEAEPVVDETVDSVKITAYKSVITDADRACTEELAYIDETVELEDPLADRELVGCRPHRGEDSDETCRDLERSRLAGIFEFTPVPTTPEPNAS